jgi:hypothetical protein
MVWRTAANWFVQQSAALTAGRTDKQRAVLMVDDSVDRMVVL